MTSLHLPAPYIHTVTPLRAYAGISFSAIPMGDGLACRVNIICLASNIDYFVIIVVIIVGHLVQQSIYVCSVTYIKKALRCCSSVPNIWIIVRIRRKSPGRVLVPGKGVEGMFLNYITHR